MNPRICICCGEPIDPQGNVLSRNPNVCASCSSMADGMEDSSIPEGETSAPERHAAGGFAEATTGGDAGGRDLESVTDLFSRGG